MNRIFFAACLLTTSWTFTGCGLFEPEKGFERMTADHTGIRFNNQINENDTFNVLRFEYIYNGGGVGVGDVNNDGLPDVFFAGNQVSSELYLNRGDFKFENVTEAAGVRTNRWCTGVAMADVNQDGWLDIYVSTVHPKKDKSVPNLLFLNKGADAKGNVRFEEVAARVGLADSTYATQAVFFDYDRDGDLDCYLLNNSLEDYNRNQPVGQRTDGSGKSVDRLYQNTGTNAEGLPVFQNVSKQAGIQTEGWGLGVVVNDINQDGWPDIYVANDFLSNDHLWINNRNGTFTNRIKQYFKHTEHNGMGVDIADINNDGLNDVVAVDMMPDDNLRQKTMFSNTGYDRFFTNLRQRYQTQYVRNVLQLNNGPSPVADSIEAPVTFSDIGYLAGIYATDWSWSSLLADFDNDGRRDLLITNGYRKDVTDLDFVTYSNDAAMFGTDETRLKRAIETVNKLEGVKKPNFLYRNKGDLTFEDMSEPWGLKIPSYSNGAAYADFDNDGDLDLVMNNINDEAFVYRNNLAKIAQNGNGFLRIKLKGDKGNAAGVGAKIWLHYAGQTQYAEHQLQRGYKSTVEDAEHFGLGSQARIDSVIVLWPGGKRQRLANVNANQTLTLSEKDAVLGKNQPKPTPAAWFAEVAKDHGLLFRHQEEDFPDFKSGQALLPRKNSQQGPAAAVGDINGDGLDDVFLGGPAQRSGVFFVQKPDGTFAKSFLEDSARAKTAEDAGVLLFDADNDGDNDLYCASGSSEFGKNLKNYRHRFYRNQGKGRFQLDSAALPAIETSGSVVAAADFDKDGDLDLFVGGRVLPTRYPYAPRSYLLQNDGKGRFRDITPQAAPDLQTPGMVSAALWSDFDNDGWTDLIITGEFMPITFLKGGPPTPEGGVKFKKAPSSGAGGAVGWWNSLAAGDFDNDGDMDYVAGNLGRNSLYQASEQEPVCVYAKDYDNNGTTDPVLCRYIQGKEYVTHPRETFTDQLVNYRRVLTSYAVYGKATFTDLFKEDMLKDALILRATYFSSTYIENQGNGKFDIRPLPVQAQFSPVYGLQVVDFDQDGNLDILAVQNDYATEPLAGWYDAGIGVCLRGDGKGGFVSLHPNESGFFADGDAKALTQLSLFNGQKMWLVTQNQGELKAFANRKSIKPSRDIRLRPDDAFAEVKLANGKTRKQEFYYGEGYLSQSARVLAVPDGAKVVAIVNSRGAKRK